MPKEAEAIEFGNRVVVKFTVSKKGKIINIRPLNGNIIYNCTEEERALYSRLLREMKKEAVRVVASMPRWSAAKENGKCVESEVTLPIYFRIKGSKLRSNSIYDLMPAYRGGTNALQKYINEKFHYPQEAIEAGISGSFELLLSPDEHGRILYPTILNEDIIYPIQQLGDTVEIVRKNALIEEIRQRVRELFKKMPQWIAAYDKNIPVRSTIVVPFVLNRKAGSCKESNNYYYWHKSANNKAYAQPLDSIKGIGLYNHYITENLQIPQQCIELGVNNTIIGTRLRLGSNGIITEADIIRSNEYLKKGTLTIHLYEEEALRFIHEKLTFVNAENLSGRCDSSELRYSVAFNCTGKGEGRTIKSDKSTPYLDATRTGREEKEFVRLDFFLDNEIIVPEEGVPDNRCSATALFRVGKDSMPKEIRITDIIIKDKNGNNNPESFKITRRLLKEHCRQIIMQGSLTPNENEQRIIFEFNLGYLHENHIDPFNGTEYRCRTAMRPSSPGTEYDAIVDSILHYPAEASAKGVEGRVYISHSSDCDEYNILGSIITTGCDTDRDIAKIFEQEALRATKAANNILPLKEKEIRVSVITLAPKKEAKKRSFDIHNLTPKFNGKTDEWIETNKQSPIEVKNANGKGYLFVRFTVDADGSVIDPEITLNYIICDGGRETNERVKSIAEEYAKSLVMSMPKWEPAKKNGVPIKSQSNLWIKF